MKVSADPPCITGHGCRFNNNISVEIDNTKKIILTIIFSKLNVAFYQSYIGSIQTGFFVSKSKRLYVSVTLSYCRYFLQDSHLHKFKFSVKVKSI